MKNYITFLLSLTATLPLFGSPSSTKLLNLFYPRHKAETIQNRKQAWKSVDTTPSIWKAGKSDTYRFNSSDEWEKEYTSSYNYRKDGLMTEEIVNYGAYSTKTEYQYNDEILTDLLTSEIYYEWNPDSQLWEIRPLSTYLEIERDNNGNVVSEKVYTHNGEEFELTQTVTISYDDNGIADYIKASIDFFGVTTITMENIVWEETDGQLILGEYYLFLGNNKLKSCDVTMEEDGETVHGNLMFEYGNNGTNFTYTGNLGETCAYLEHESTDQNGSYKETLFNYIDANSNGIMDESEMTLKELTEMQYNEKGLITFDYEYEYDAIDAPHIFESTSGSKYDYTYDEAYGIPSEVVISTMDSFSTEYRQAEKIIYYDFIDTANPGSVDNTFSNGFSISVNGNTLECNASGLHQYRIYDLNGRLISKAASINSDDTSIDITSLTPGIYILQAVTTNSVKTTKFIKR